MFINGIEKFLKDQHVDTIRQERELLKQVAVLSSAILGISILNFDKIQSFGLLIKLGLIGLFITIIFSILLLTLVLRLEKLEIYNVKNSINIIPRIIGEYIKGKLDKSNDRSGRQDEKFSIFRFINEVVDEIKGFCKKFKEEDEKMREKRKKFKNRSSLYAYLSYAVIGIFCISLGMILIDVIKIIFYK